MVTSLHMSWLNFNMFFSEFPFFFFKQRVSLLLEGLRTWRARVVVFSGEQQVGAEAVSGLVLEDDVI